MEGIAEGLEVEFMDVAILNMNCDLCNFWVYEDTSTAGSKGCSDVLGFDSALSK